jgi:DNA-binding MarR family transcriptional regulator/N-acetylglutamate synthase-like GNAT family acetyltransferase
MEKFIQQIRSFNRFYTSHIGLLKSNFLETPYSLTEARILFEIDRNCPVTSQHLCDELSLDKGYMSRIIKTFLNDGILEKSQSEEDKRAYYLNLNEKGIELISDLHHRSGQQIAEQTEQLTEQEKLKLIAAMQTVQGFLSKEFSRSTIAENVRIREGLNPGDIGYLIHLHGKLYAEESQYDQDFEKYVLKTFGEFMDQYQPKKDKIWIAEYNNEIIGCVAIMQRSSDEAQLRWFLTLPTFRGTGVGKKLFQLALEHCKYAGLSNLFLLTTSVQEKAIAMYQNAGFTKTESTESIQWGQKMTEERYDLKL